MQIKCKQCGHKETINVLFFFRSVGLGMALLPGGVFGLIPWLGMRTGLAMPICTAIVLGGARMFSSTIVEWANKHAPCSNCGSKNWKSE